MLRHDKHSGSGRRKVIDWVPERENKGTKTGTQYNKLKKTNYEGKLKCKGKAKVRPKTGLEGPEGRTEV
jgi:hypothetical protein